MIRGPISPTPIPRMSLDAYSTSSTPVDPNSLSPPSPFSLIEKDITAMDPEIEAPGGVIAPTEPSIAVLEPSLEKKVKDVEFYMETVTFEVENTLFRVPTYSFRASTNYFTPHFDSFSDGHVCENEGILRLEGVTTKDFRALLKLMYRLPIPISHTPSSEEWISILKLSTKWMMLDIRRVAIESLTKASLSSGRRFILAREYSVVPWLRAAYLSLVKKNWELSESYLPTPQVGLDTVFRLQRVRELALRPNKGSQEQEDRYNPHNRFNPNDDIQQLIGELEKPDPYPTAVDRVALARQSNVTEWLHSAFVELVERKELLSVEEAKAIGYETSIRLCGARERHILAMRSQDQYNCSPTVQTQTRHVDEELGGELGALESHSAVKRAIMAKECGIIEWLRSAFLEIFERDEMLSIDDAFTLGLETAIRLCRIRQKYYSSGYSISDTAYQSVIDSEFSVELKEVEIAGERYSMEKEGSGCNDTSVPGKGAGKKSKKGKKK